MFKLERTDKDYERKLCISLKDGVTELSLLATKKELYSLYTELREVFKDEE